MSETDLSGKRDKDWWLKEYPKRIESLQTQLQQANEEIERLDKEIEAWREFNRRAGNTVDEMEAKLAHYESAIKRIRMGAEDDWILEILKQEEI